MKEGDFKITENFTFFELTDSTRYPELVAQNRLDAMSYQKQLKYLAGAWEEVRSLLKVAIDISSGYRNPTLNRKVGSRALGHTTGLCGDGIPRMDVAEAFKIIMVNRHLLPSVRKVIFETIKGDKWLHIEAKTEAGQPQDFYTTLDGKTYTRIA